MTVAETKYGKVRGAEIADGMIDWRGVPYARPPVGALRFRPPEPPEPWAGVRDALEYGNRSLQGEPGPPVPGAPPTDEDCLYLNVTAPTGPSGRPVLFWLHGGGYETGDAAQAAEDGAAFARSHQIVVVTINYRLGALGFLDVPGESPTGAAGLHDQLAALRWTRENIAAFGGDPDQITIYGLSAGGKSVTNLLASPLASGMIARAAESSGGDHVKDAAQAEAPTGRSARARGRPGAPVRARDRHPERSARHHGDAAFHLDVAAVRRRRRADRQSADRDRGGPAARVPLLLQTCARECALYALLAPDGPGQADRAPAGYFGQRTAARMLAAYVACFAPRGRALRTLVMTDERYIVRTGRLAEAQAKHAPVWRSRYDGPYTGLDNDPDPAFAQYAPRLIAAHGGDAVGIWQGGPACPPPCTPPGARSPRPATPAGCPTRPPACRPMIFAPDGPRVEAEPFAAINAIWSGLTWQPGPWWPIDGVT